MQRQTPFESVSEEAKSVMEERDEAEVYPASYPQEKISSIKKIPVPFL